MTPKEKAKQLFDKFSIIFKLCEDKKDKIISSSLICVDEIIKDIDNPNNAGYVNGFRVSYWKRVQNEIKKL